ncbi:MAG TPA: transferase, partial [Actinomycetales bacterium]|nr:transferase [Actinomycetales bacterium]
PGNASTAPSGSATAQVELRHGSLLEPVADAQFDLIVSNPPFVITPTNSGLPAYEYRDGARRGDQLVENLVTDIGAHLKPGGIAQFLGNWEHRDAAAWQERLGDWLDAAAHAGFPLDAWIVEREVQDPAQYAETWLADGGCDPRRDPARFDQAYRAWLEDFATRQVTGIGFGYVLLRRPAPGKSPQIRRIEHIDTPVHRPLGGHISAVLEQVDALAELSDGQILAQHFERAPDVTEERYATPGAADPTMIFLRQGDGYGRSMQVSTWQSAFVGACDGELSAGQICGALAQLGQLEVAAVIAEVLPFLDTAVWGGFLTLADAPAS